MKIFLSFLMALIIIIFPTYSYACTAWGCIGTSVQGNGVLISKNRDMIDKTPWAMKIVNPKEGKYKFLAMCADKNDDYSIRGGINQAGLVVFNEDASSHPHEIQSLEQQNVMYTILAKCSSVEEVLQHAKEYFLGTVFLLLADKDELVYVEIVADNEYKLKRIKEGYFYHTNHYTDSAYIQYNQKPVPSSIIRYNRIAQLVQSKFSFALEDCIAFSKDKNADANTSICRDGDSTHPARTLGNMSVYIPHNNTSPKVYMSIRNKGQKKFKEDIVTLTPQFWNTQFSIE